MGETLPENDGKIKAKPSRNLSNSRCVPPFSVELTKANSSRVAWPHSITPATPTKPSTLISLSGVFRANSTAPEPGRPKAARDSRVIFHVQFTRTAQEDLERLFGCIIERELASATSDLDIADHALEAFRAGILTLQTSPFTCRKASNSPFRREPVIPFGSSSYAAPFEIASANEVVIASVRHQSEDDYH